MYKLVYAQLFRLMLVSNAVKQLIFVSVRDMTQVDNERRTINSDLMRERSRVSFDCESLSQALYGVEKLNRKRYIGIMRLCLTIDVLVTDIQ